MSSEPAPAAKGSQPAPGEICLRATNVSKCYEIYARPVDRLKQTLWRGKRRFYREFWALRDISIELRRGESLGILGRNGSGKSTLLQIIAGTLRPTTGQVEVNGRVAALLELGSGFNPEFSGRDNVFLNGMILGLSRGQVQERFDEIAAFADIGEFLEQPVKTYSSGMVVRLAFAVQAMLDPDILIVDEALAVGDALFQKRCFRRIEQLLSGGTTLLFVSHDQESVRTLTSKAILLEDGQMRAAGRSAEVVLEYRRLLHEAEKRYFNASLTSAAPKPQVEPTTPPVDDTGATGEPGGAGRRSELMSFGDRDAEIVAVAILDAGGQHCTVFRPGEKIRIRAIVRVNAAVSGLHVGLRIRSREGVKIYSWGTFNQDVAVWQGGLDAPVFWEREFQAGETVMVEFDFDCRLGTNFYEIQAFVAQERRKFFGDQRMLHWRDEAAFFQTSVVAGEHFFGGVCDLEARARVVAIDSKNLRAEMILGGGGV